jgi:hypothetical protein
LTLSVGRSAPSDAMTMIVIVSGYLTRLPD